MHKKAHGFTIVELLIVIVVIGILAAISMVTYSGVSNSANDSAIKSDLANFAKQIQLVRAELGVYPSGGYLTQVEGGSSTGSASYAPGGVSFRVTKSAYDEPTGAGAVNLIYCTGVNINSGLPGFGILAKSKSGYVFKYSSAEGLEIGWPSGSVSAARCMQGMEFPRTLSYGFMTNSGGWNSWAE